LIETLLAPEGHHVRTACDGAEALRMVQSAPPDLVLMDVTMPLLDGIEVCRSIKQNPRTRLSPVVLITSLSDTPSRIRGVDAGADDSIGKPFNALERGGYLHDVGKVGIPDAVLLKPGPLTPPEYELIKQHTIIGDRLCGELRSLRSVRPIVRHHHERLDGSGYPDGLRADEIPLLAQIMGIVDVFDALTTARPYKAARSFNEAAAELRSEVARGWRRADLVSTFLEQIQHQ
jgi:response regulator RpfG family c-di-GMP phosphodiesterase